MIELILILIVVGFILFLFNRFVPLDANIKSLINYLVLFVLFVVVVLFLLKAFGIYDGPDLKLK
jgi:hypothetical protein